jgi:hypothetical protein
MLVRYANIVAFARAKGTFKTIFDIGRDVSHHSTDECVYSTVYRSVAATKCAGDALGFARAIRVTLNLDLDLWRVIHQLHVISRNKPLRQGRSDAR